MPDPQTTNLILTVVGSLLVGVFVITNGALLYRKLRSRNAPVTDSAASAPVTDSSETVVTDAPLPSELAPPPNQGDVTLEIQQNLTSPGENVEGRIENRLELLDELVGEADREIENLSEILEEMRPGSSLSSAESGMPSDFDWRDTAPNRPAFDETHRRMIGNLFQSGYSTSDIASLTGSREAAIEAIVRPNDRDAA